MHTPTAILLLTSALALSACGVSGPTSQGSSPTEPAESAEASTDDIDPMTDATGTPDSSGSTETATLGAGCFWCVEAVYDQIEGVSQVVSGYMGGEVESPTYKAVCTGETGHAEVCQLTFDPTVVSFEEILDLFWRLHDPTTLNRQGNDVGTQYRSAIFYHSEAQREAAEASRGDAQGAFADPIVTEITAASTFYPAEDYHQDYYFQNQSQGYCQMVIKPKLKKLGLEH